MDKITTVGLDLAKQVISVHAVDARGMLVMRKVLRRDALLAWSAALPPCGMAMEACGGAHHRARELTRQRHTARIIAAEFVRPIRKSGKNGVGPLTAAAVVVTVGQPQEFRNGRQFAAWLGLVPKQRSTGGRTRLGRITRRGDAYLRTLLILGARSALQAALRKPPAFRHRLQRWIVNVFGRIGYHKTLVAIANKHARIIWALLVKGEDFDVQRLT